MTSQVIQPRLGLDHSSGWSSLSHGNGEQPASSAVNTGDLMNFGAIADAAVDEMFGSDDEFGRRGRAVGRRGSVSKRRSVPRRRRSNRLIRKGQRLKQQRQQRRRSRRAGSDSIAWQQSGGGIRDISSVSAEDLLGPYTEDGGVGSDMLDAEIDALLAEDDDYGFDDEYGEDDYTDYGDDDYIDYGSDDYTDYGGDESAAPSAKKTGCGCSCAAAPERFLPVPIKPEVSFGYGEDDHYGAYYGVDLPAIQPPNRGSLFVDSFVTGAGVGLGVATAILGISALSRGLSSK